jgi:hypothetical protein
VGGEGELDQDAVDAGVGVVVGDDLRKIGFFFLKKKVWVKKCAS